MTTEATRRECMLRAIDNVQQQQFTFAPSINPRSRRVWLRSSAVFTTPAGLFYLTSKN